MNLVQTSARVQQPGDDALAARLKEVKIFDKRWELLKNTLHPLFQQETVKAIANAVKVRFRFEASEQQYKYRFKQWGWTKNNAQLPMDIKCETLTRARKRAARGKVTTAEYKGQAILPQRLQSAIGTLSNNDNLTISEMFQSPILHNEQFGSYMPFSNSLLLIWNMPFGARPSVSTPPWMRPSPSVAGKTPDGLIIKTPAHSVPTPSGTGTVCTSIMPAVQLQRAKMMAQGNFQGLLKTMDLEEQRTLSTWLYQYWFFSFVTAQEWGRGHRRWSANLLGFAAYAPVAPASVTNTPHNNAGLNTPDTRREGPRPPDTCRWTTHVDEENTMRLDIYEFSPEDEDPNSRWPQKAVSAPMEEHLRSALQENDFSDIPEAQLPVPIAKVVKAAQRSASDLLLESLAFAIMGRNLDLVSSCLDKAIVQELDIGSIHPLHIATSYLDGGNICCLIIDELCSFLGWHGRYKTCITNDHGHSVLDNLFLTVLRSHSTAPLAIVDTAVGDRASYAGIEVDLCGRWSADSHCFRTLVASGNRTIPSTWKHKFCHTSIQAVCHAMTIICENMPWSFTEQSGLFGHTCPEPSCGLRMQPSPLHTLVVVAMFLATYGCAAEDLFGMIACYLCMISQGMDPLKRVSLSVRELLGKARADDSCDHMEMTPSELAIQGRRELSSLLFTDRVSVGLECMIAVMQMAEDTQTARNTSSQPSPSSTAEDNTSNDEEINHFVAATQSLTPRDNGAMMLDEMDVLVKTPRKPYALAEVPFRDMCCECEKRALADDPLCFAANSGLGHAWAVIQAELLNYRRMTCSDGWYSSYFSVQTLLNALTTNGPLEVGYIKDDMLMPYCSCGVSLRAGKLPLRQDMFKHFCSNMDGSQDAWKRTSFIGQPRFVRGDDAGEYD